MISDSMGIYKKFNTQQIKFTPSNTEVQKELANEKKEANKNINTNKAILLSSPATGFATGAISSILYSSNKNKELLRSIENYKNGLELGFDTSPLTQQINDSIKQSKDTIKKAQIENQNIKNAGHILDSIDARNAEIVEINNGIIKRESEFAGKMKKQLSDIRTKIVDSEFKKSKFSQLIAQNIKYDTDITEDVKKIINDIV